MWEVLQSVSIYFNVQGKNYACHFILDQVKCAPCWHSMTLYEQWKYKEVEVELMEINGTLSSWEQDQYVMRFNGPEKCLIEMMAAPASPCKHNEAK